MHPLLILPLLAFVILLVLFALVLRRAGRFLAQTRDVERFRRQVGDLGGRVEKSLGEVSAQVDAVRRGQVGADALGDDLSASLDAVWIWAIWPPISSVARAVWAARLFTSAATTAKPRPASPARAASMVALSASRLVCAAIDWIRPTTSPMRAAAFDNSLTRPVVLRA